MTPELTPAEIRRRRALLVAILADEEPMYITALAFLEDALNGPVVGRVVAWRALDDEERDELEFQAAVKTARMYRDHAALVAPALDHTSAIVGLALTAAWRARRYYEHAAKLLERFSIDYA